VRAVTSALIPQVVLRNKAMQTTTNIFIVNMAVSDVLMCIFAVPLTPVHSFMDNWIFGEIICKLFTTTQVSRISLFRLQNCLRAQLLTLKSEGGRKADAINSHLVFFWHGESRQQMGAGTRGMHSFRSLLDLPYTRVVECCLIFLLYTIRQGLSIYMSTLTLVAIAVNRYVAILHPHQPPWTTKFAMKLVKNFLPRYILPFHARRALHFSPKTSPIPDPKMPILLFPLPFLSSAFPATSLPSTQACFWRGESHSKARRLLYSPSQESTRSTQSESGWPY